MAGAGLIAIKRRIKSVTSTKKITKAMGLVATAKLRKTKVKLNTNQKFHNTFDEIMKEILDNYPSNMYSVYTHGNKSVKKLYIVLTSDSGLCGGFNTSVVNVAIEELKLDKENSLIMLIGGKGKPYLKKYKFEFATEFTDLPDIPTIKEAGLIVDKALQMYKNNEIGEVYVINTRFHSTVNQVVTKSKILPLDYKPNDEFKKYVKFEPQADMIIDEVIHMYLKQEVLNFMLNSKASEQSSRMTAMDGATKNANEILDDLKLQHNRIRQGAITQEISEIVGGAEAQK